MKKSEIYHTAMCAVLGADYSEDITIEILAVLMEDKASALYWEKKKEEEQQAAKEAAE